MLQKKNIILGKAKFFIFLIIFQFFFNQANAEMSKQKEKYAELNILDKVSSKSSNITIEIGEETFFQNLIIKVMKCYNSKFDDDPEVTAYMQVKDIVNKDDDRVYIFNDWTFASSPSIRPFDHPVYDIWLKKCYS